MMSLKEMEEQRLEINEKYFNDRLEKFGPTVHALGWGTEESQLIRFKVLSEISNLHGKTVLDFGCGFGDLYAFLGPDVKYLGFDLNPRVLAEARNKYPEAKFVDGSIPGDYVSDYVLASGVFNLVRDWQEDVRHTWSFARCGMAFNFTSEWADHQIQSGPYVPNERRSYPIVFADPLATLKFFRDSITRRLVLRHDYKENDFTIYAYK